MFKVGDLILYGSTGVCRVVDITPNGPMGTDQDHHYYELAPLYQNCTIFVPTNTTKVFMRPIITKDEAKRLVDMIPGMQVEVYNDYAMNQLTQHYKASLETHDCYDLLELCMSTYARKKAAEQQNKKFGAIDEKYMKRAEDLLFGELAAALGMDREQVNEYIAEKVNGELGN